MLWPEGPRARNNEDQDNCFPCSGSLVLIDTPEVDHLHSVIAMPTDRRCETAWLTGGDTCSEGTPLQLDGSGVTTDPVARMDKRLSEQLMESAERSLLLSIQRKD